MLKNVETEVEIEYKDGTNDTVTYNIFKPINDGIVSKAIVAQYLAFILEQDSSDKYKGILESDEYLKYMIDAIKHVTPEVI